MYEASCGAGQKGLNHEFDALGRRISPWPYQPLQRRSADVTFSTGRSLPASPRCGDLPTDRRGAVVALDPLNGDVLCCTPSVDDPTCSADSYRARIARLIDDRPGRCSTLDPGSARAGISVQAVPRSGDDARRGVPDETGVPCRGGSSSGADVRCHAVHGGRRSRRIITSCERTSTMSV